jgi:hypothetical protein
MTQSIKITALTNIGANIAYTSLVPVVNMSGTPETQKANLQIVGNLILNGAGGSYFPAAAQAVLSATVSNAAQPNITSVGTLTSLDVSGNITGANANLGNLVVANFFSGDGGFLSNITGTFSNANVANYLPTYAGNVGANNISVTNDLNVSGTTTLGPVNTGYIGAGGNVSVPTSDYFVGNLRTNTISSVSNVSVVADAGNINATWVFGAGGALYWPGPYQWAIEPNPSNEFEIHSESNVIISTDTSNANSHFTFDTSGIFRAPSNVVLSGTTLFIGPNAESATYLTDPTIIVGGNSNTYVQAVMFNENGDGSVDWIAQGANGTNDEGYTDFGFNGDNFSDANYSLTGAGDGYVFVQTYANTTGGNLVFATGDNGTTKDIIFGTGGFTANAEFARMSDANNAFELARANAAVVATIVKTTPVTVSALPLAATVGAGARAFVTDADSATFGAPAVGGAANSMPVFSDGTGWFIG